MTHEAAGAKPQGLSGSWGCPQSRTQARPHRRPPAETPGQRAVPLPSSPGGQIPQVPLQGGELPEDPSPASEDPSPTSAL